MSQLDATVPSSVFEGMAAVAVSTAKLRTYPSRYADDVRGEVVNGIPLDIEIRCSPLLDYSNRYEKPTDSTKELVGFVIIAAHGLSVTPEHGMELIGLGGDYSFFIEKVTAYRSGLLDVAFECHLRK